MDATERLKTLRRRLERYQRTGSVRALARLAELQNDSLRKIISGKTKNPGLHTVEAIEGALDAAEAVAPRKGRRASKPTRKTAKNLGGGSRRTREPRASVAPASPGRDGSETPATTSGSAPSPATANTIPAPEVRP